MPEPVIKGGFASPESIAHIAVQKFVMGSPLYRQEQEWAQNGILLCHQTLCQTGSPKPVKIGYSN
jgi:transposase